MNTATLRRILLVDDDPDIRHLATLSLARVGGYDVQAVGSGAEALEAARAEAPDLVLLDVQMTGLDGFETLDLLRAEPGLEAVPVVMLTADADARTAECVRSGNVAGVLPKPFDPLQLPQQLLEVLGG
jgi:CheY-like chemotaxis protein